MNRTVSKIFIILFSIVNIVLLQDIRSQLSTSHCLFDNDSLLMLSLTANFTDLIKNKEEGNYYKGECVFHWSGGDKSNLPVKIKARGYHRMKNCFLPPLMLNFKPDSVFMSDGHYGKIKLVTHCQNLKIYPTYVLKEYLIYKLYEIISPYHFRTRLVDINYRDTGKKERNENNIGFLIEPLDALCKRTGCIEIKKSYFGDSEINALEADRVALFMYMIGNTDWRIKSGHNIKFIKPLTHRVHQAIPVPYDFDHAGFINTSYATPSEWSRAEKVTERDYIGKCRQGDATYDELISDFLAKESQVYQTIEDFGWLEPKTRKTLVKYIKTFYDKLKKPERFKKHLHNTCMDKY